jgi:hypothetical protein
LNKFFDKWPFFSKKHCFPLSQKALLILCYSFITHLKKLEDLVYSAPR